MLCFHQLLYSGVYYQVVQPAVTHVHTQVLGAEGKKYFLPPLHPYLHMYMGHSWTNYQAACLVQNLMVVHPMSKNVCVLKPASQKP